MTAKPGATTEDGLRSITRTLIALLLLLNLESGCGRSSADSSNYELRESGYRVAWDLTQVPHKMEPGWTITVKVRIKNVGTDPWYGVRSIPGNVTGAYAVRLSQQWWSGDGSRVVLPWHNRGDLAETLNPGESADLQMEVTPPLKPGLYQLQFDLVQEMVSWFEMRGAEKAFVEVLVEEGAKRR